MFCSKTGFFTCADFYKTLEGTSNVRNFFFGGIRPTTWTKCNSPSNVLRAVLAKVLDFILTHDKGAFCISTTKREKVQSFRRDNILLLIIASQLRDIQRAYTLRSRNASSTIGRGALRAEISTDLSVVVLCHFCCIMCPMDSLEVYSWHNILHFGLR